MFAPFGTPTMEGAVVSFKFEGDFDGLEVGRFASVVSDYSSLVANASSYIAPGFQVEARIVSLTPGCLDAVLGFVASGLTVFSALPGGPVETLRSCVEMASSALDLYKATASHGGAVNAKQEGEGTQIIMGDGSKLEFSRNEYYYACDKDNGRLVKSMASNIVSCKGVDGVTVTEKARTAPMFEADASDFRGISNVVLPEPVEEREIFDVMTLEIVSPVYDTSRKWRFRSLDGNVVAFDMEDQTFLDNVVARADGYDVGPRTLIQARVRWRYIPGRTDGGKRGAGSIVEVLEVIEPE